MSSSKRADALVDFDRLPNSAHVRLPVVQHLTGYSRASVWRRAADALDAFPKPRKLGPGNTGWNVGDIRRFLAGCANG
jgi:predicted DNA-binding transcriptional regulator AlpA